MNLKPILVQESPYASEITSVMYVHPCNYNEIMEWFKRAVKVDELEARVKELEAELDDIRYRAME